MDCSRNSFQLSIPIVSFLCVKGWLFGRYMPLRCKGRGAATYIGSTLKRRGSRRSRGGQTWHRSTVRDYCRCSRIFRTPAVPTGLALHSLLMTLHATQYKVEGSQPFFMLPFRLLSLYRSFPQTFGSSACQTFRPHPM